MRMPTSVDNGQDGTETFNRGRGRMRRRSSQVITVSVKGSAIDVATIEARPVSDGELRRWLRPRRVCQVTSTAADIERRCAVTLQLGYTAAFTVPSDRREDTGEWTYTIKTMR